MPAKPQWLYPPGNLSFLLNLQMLLQFPAQKKREQTVLQADRFPFSLAWGLQIPVWRSGILYAVFNQIVNTPRTRPAIRHTMLTPQIQKKQVLM